MCRIRHQSDTDPTQMCRIQHQSDTLPNQFKKMTRIWKCSNSVSFNAICLKFFLVGPLKISLRLLAFSELFGRIFFDKFAISLKNLMLFQGFCASQIVCLHCKYSLLFPLYIRQKSVKLQVFICSFAKPFCIMSNFLSSFTVYNLWLSFQQQFVCNYSIDEETLKLEMFMHM